MPDALTQALANAAANSPKGEELHLENLDSIADPSQDEQLLTSFKEMATNHVRNTQPPSVFEQQSLDEYNEFMQKQYQDVYADGAKAHLVVEPEQDGLLLARIEAVFNKVDLTNLRLDALADMISEVSTTISKAAQSMPQEPDLKHRSLHEWDDTYLINELVERENALMPFYYELLKRIGSPDLHNLVMSSMQGKNSSMIVLAQLCAALGTVATQPQPQLQSQSQSQSQTQTQTQTQTHIPEAELQRLEQMSSLDRKQFAQQMNQSTIPVTPKPRYFGQATEEYIKQTNNPNLY